MKKHLVPGDNYGANGMGCYILHANSITLDLRLCQVPSSPTWSITNLALTFTLKTRFGAAKLFILGNFDSVIIFISITIRERLDHAKDHASYEFQVSGEDPDY